MSLANKICVITGAGTGIGEACALEMAAQGAEAVAILDVEVSAAERTAAQVRDADTVAAAYACDVADEDSVRATMEAVGADFGRIDALHNNAAVLEMRWTDRTTVDTLEVETRDRVFAVNVRGSWLCTKHAVPWMRRSTSGAIVNMSSVAGLFAVENEAAYGASKAAILGLTRATALDLAPDGIRCNCCCPSWTATPLVLAAIDDPDHEAAVGPMKATHLVDRLATPSDVAKLVCFLASDDAAFINGVDHRIDGGATAWRGLRPN